MNPVISLSGKSLTTGYSASQPPLLEDVQRSINPKNPCSHLPPTVPHWVSPSFNWAAVMTCTLSLELHSFLLLERPFVNCWKLSILFCLFKIYTRYLLMVLKCLLGLKLRLFSIGSIKASAILICAFYKTRGCHINHHSWLFLNNPPYPYKEKNHLNFRF